MSKIKICRNCENFMIHDNGYLCLLENKDVRSNDSCVMFIEFSEGDDCYE